MEWVDRLVLAFEIALVVTDENGMTGFEIQGYRVCGVEQIGAMDEGQWKRCLRLHLQRKIA